MKSLDSFFFLSEKKFFLKRFFFAVKKHHFIFFISFYKSLPIDFLNLAKTKMLVMPGVFSLNPVLTKICSGQTFLLSFSKSSLPFLVINKNFFLLSFIYKKVIFPVSFIKWFYLFLGTSFFSNFFRFFYFVIFLKNSRKFLGK